MKELLSNSNTYVIIKKNPIKRLTNEVRNLLTNWLKKEYIDIYTVKC